jgi:hypothetical protein
MAAFGPPRKDGNKPRAARVPSSMEPLAVPPSRRLLASLSLGASAVGLGWLAATDWLLGGWSMAGVTALVAAGAIGLSRRGVVTQVLSRGVAWVVLTPMFFALADAIRGGRLPAAGEVFFAATSAGALLLARPALHTQAARAEFAPHAHRRLFLAGAVASATAGIVAGLGAAGTHSFALAALGIALLASAVGVARMRAWGVLLGIVASVGSLGAALMVRDITEIVWLALAAAPGLMLGATVVAARLRGAGPPSPTAAPLRVASLQVEVEPVRARVAVATESELEPRALAARVAAGE